MCSSLQMKLQGLFRGHSTDGFYCTWEGSDTRPSRKRVKDSKSKMLRARPLDTCLQFASRLHFKQAELCRAKKKRKKKQRGPQKKGARNKRENNRIRQARVCGSRWSKPTMIWPDSMHQVCILEVDGKSQICRKNLKLLKLLKNTLLQCSRPLTG